MSELRGLLRLVTAPKRRSFLAAGACAVAAGLAGLALVALAGWFIAAAAVAGAAGVIAVQAFNYLLPSALIRLLAILRTASRYGERLWSHEAALFSLATLRTRLFELIAARSARVPAGTVNEAILVDVAALEDRLIRRPSDAGALAAGIACVAVTLAAGMAATCAVLLILASMLAVGRYAAGCWLPDAAMRMQQRIGALRTRIGDRVAAAPEILAYGLEPVVEQEIAQAGCKADRARLAFARIEASVTALPMIAGGLAAGAVSLLSTADLPCTVMALLAVLAGTEQLGSIIRSMARDAVARAGLDRLAGLVVAGDAVDSEPESEQDPPAVPGDETGLQLRDGERLVITGPSGSGKTTLLEGLAGLREAGSLVRLADSCPEEGYLAGAGVRRCALAPQSGGIIAGTIADNLRLAAPGLADEALWEALRIACLEREVRAMPAGLLTWVGDGGLRLSGGQRKRLTIARALLARPSWLLLDEPSEGLDPATDQQLCRNLDAWLHRTGAGLVAVTHRDAVRALATRQMTLGNREPSAQQRAGALP
ncbi:MAG: ATP-binding cassette domain-containing protein [Sphingobium sp.]|uniref:ATP-binding cassette domain-containing protein n=1 Tax=unclassified Sphingobium TaxID=2611147 RepID=UPI0003D5E844|nr:ATP-binding cassette domain-containing protein [Sphingobium sp. C100]ETI65804.1 ABC transporter [Sphingobium sp. C100]